ALRCGSGMGLIAVGAVCLAEAGEKSNSALPETVTVSRDVLLDHIYGGWVGMLIGGLEGLPHENKYNEKPRETLPDFKYLPDGARTDDDNDFEWTHLYFMDKERICWAPEIRYDAQNKNYLIATRFPTATATPAKRASPGWSSKRTDVSSKESAAVKSNNRRKG
ncbi:MAG: hypothetical protein NTV46_02500, partial [Verrucomicrobia bacterium]|nr:hypothetical protein [Verrucomicrobiota bacterium]